ncbi:NAD-dependent epimerase/dehydratase family protein [Mycobacterium sp.]|uniref:NAD-dependent epimerase/dehydratase family protein n=1 Tax=Mycobacterium sp. TaxID=1785 RepID=UPI002DA026CF|nr:NAD(P)-dependent oxidoreductase [Mycobacterium sp.]
MLEDRKILVTGATGQIAGPIAEDFVKNNEVWCAARFSDPARKAELEALGIKAVQWDMDSGDNSALPDDFTHVVHSALHVSPDYDESITNNAESSALLMQHCRKAQAFLHVSSSCVYKPHSDHPNHAYAENDPLGGLASYAEVYPVIKMTSEGAVRAAARMLNLPTTIARMNVGYSWTGHGGLPVMQYNTFKNGQPWLVPIGYSNIGSPIGGEDIAAQAHLLLEAATVPTTIVNWAGDDPVTDRQMGEYVAELTGVTASFIETPISFDSFWSDNARREQLIGKCSVHWKDGVRNTFERLGIIDAA